MLGGKSKVHTHKHIRLLSLSGSSECQDKKDKGLKCVDRRLVDIDLSPGGRRILFAELDCRPVSAGVEREPMHCQYIKRNSQKCATWSVIIDAPGRNCTNGMDEIIG